MSATEALECLFSYGTLQMEVVQLAVFGRKLEGEPDTLIGYRRTTIDIPEDSIAATSGAATYFNVEYTGRESDSVAGTVFQVARKELEQADVYELDADYRRVSVVLKSGTRAWVYQASATPLNVRM
jgi:gamma-glutamylcyclotransferase (GGCT)/AIG2-like uncharacterized protein YtfP